MEVYKTKTDKIHGTHWWLVSKDATIIYKGIKNKTKRRPYVRSAYFSNEKIFLELFWRHLYQKQNIRDKTRRLKYFPCALDLIIHSKQTPFMKENMSPRGEILYRFMGVTGEGSYFFVQIKEDRKTGEKWLMSVFPWENKKRPSANCSI